MTRPLTPRQLLERATSEKAFQAAVIELFQFQHWAVYHTFDARRSQPGFPDLVAIRAPRLIFAELKVDRPSSKTTPAQEWWLNSLAAVAAENKTLEVYEWRPHEWDAIEKVAA